MWVNNQLATIATTHISFSMPSGSTGFKGRSCKATAAEKKLPMAQTNTMLANQQPYRFYLYDGANHAFNNDTSVERYDKAAATLAWGRTVAFFKRHLA